ncbi:MAG: hypothetical protein HN368_04270, partial [Spirochaetales bacterium]|nr:hypothetical protein [Spirochaetales bacterium]
MKTSNKFIISIAAAIVVLVIGGVITSRLIVANMSRSEPGSGSRLFTLGDFVSKNIETESFAGLNTSGSWEVNIAHGENRSVTVEAPQDIADLLVIDVRKGILKVGFKREVNLSDMPKLRMEIVVPTLESVESSGQLDVSLSGFRNSPLSLQSSGAISVQADECSFSDLEIDTSGAGNIDLG